MNKYILNKCNDIINKREITEYEYSYCERVLTEALKVEQNAKVYGLLGKLYLYKGQTSKSKYYFNKALEIKENKTSYYGLLKVNILEQNYLDAHNNLNKYLKGQVNLNLDLYKLLIDMNLGENNEYQIDDRFFYEKLSGDNLIIYLNAVKSILEKDYSKAKELFTKLEQNVIDQNIFLTFKYIIRLIENLIIKKSYLDNNIFEEKLELLEQYRWNNDSNNIENLINELLSFNLNHEQQLYLLHQIPKLLNIDEYNISIKINNNIKNKNNKLAREVSFYERLIFELKEIYDLQGEKQEKFHKTFRNGMDKLNNGEFEKALDFFEAGLYKTNINLFNYYCGKANFMLGNFKQARRYFNEYSNGGAYRISYCKHYLSIIDHRFGKKGKAIKLAEDAEYFAGLLNKTYKSKLKKDLSEKKLDKLFELIDMTEEDFLEEKVLKK